MDIHRKGLVVRVYEFIEKEKYKVQCGHITTIQDIRYPALCISFALHVGNEEEEKRKGCEGQVG